MLHNGCNFSGYNHYFFNHFSDIIAIVKHEASPNYKCQSYLKYGCNNSVKDRTCSSYPSDSICNDCINNTACSH